MEQDSCVIWQASRGSPANRHGACARSISASEAFRDSLFSLLRNISQKIPCIETQNTWPSQLELVPLLCYHGTMNTKPPIVHINVRFPVDLIDELRRVAREDGRSLHGEILWILRDYVVRRKREQA